MSQLLNMEMKVVASIRVGDVSLARYRPGEVFKLFPRLQTCQKAKAEHLSRGERQMVAIARALIVPSKLILLDEPFEGLAPAVVNEVMEALVKLRGKVAVIAVEHHAETVLTIMDKACVLVNGAVAYEGEAGKLGEDRAPQAKLLGVVQDEESTSFARESIA